MGASLRLTQSLRDWLRHWNFRKIYCNNLLIRDLRVWPIESAKFQVWCTVTKYLSTRGRDEGLSSGTEEMRVGVNAEVVNQCLLSIQAFLKSGLPQVVGLVGVGCSGKSID